jgi:hypothetical protein
MKLDSEIKDYAKPHTKRSIPGSMRPSNATTASSFSATSSRTIDAMGTQMGLYTFLKDNFPAKEIHFVGDNHVSFTPRLFPETERLNDELGSIRPS